jgi:hypothetical protein
VTEDEDLGLAVPLVTRRRQSEDTTENHVEEREQHPRARHPRSAPSQAVANEGKPVDAAVFASCTIRAAQSPCGGIVTSTSFLIIRCSGCASELSSHEGGCAYGSCRSAEADTTLPAT